MGGNTFARQGFTQECRVTPQDFTSFADKHSHPTGKRPSAFPHGPAATLRSKIRCLGRGCIPSLDKLSPKPRAYRCGESGSKQVLATSVARGSQQSPSSKSSSMLLHSMWQTPSRRFQEKQRPGLRQSPPS